MIKNKAKAMIDDLEKFINTHDDHQYLSVRKVMSIISTLQATLSVLPNEYLLNAMFDAAVGISSGAVERNNEDG